MTFYYFADEYINFNSLVTDLFKIYKTRIWMSAINPASFQTPLGGVQIPGGLGTSSSNGFNIDVDHHPNRRQQRQHQTPISGGAVQQAPGAFEHTWNSSRDSGAINGIAFPQAYSRTFQNHDLDVRPLEQYPLDYRQGFPQTLNMNSSFTSPNYNLPALHNSASFNSRPDSSNGGLQSSQARGHEWTQSMQGLSLGQ